MPDKLDDFQPSPWKEVDRTSDQVQDEKDPDTGTDFPEGKNGHGHVEKSYELEKNIADRRKSLVKTDDNIPSSSQADQDHSLGNLRKEYQQVGVNARNTSTIIKQELRELDWQIGIWLCFQFSFFGGLVTYSKVHSTVSLPGVILTKGKGWIG